MSRVCDITGAKPLRGRKIHRRGLAKKKGGIGQHVTATTPRYFQPNLRTKRVSVPVLQKFVTGKITRAMSRMHLGLQDTLYLGNLNARRDWGHARDFVEAQWLMLQQPSPDDYVIATGVQHSVREFVERAAMELGISIEWGGNGADEHGLAAAVPDGSAIREGQRIVAIDQRYYRPAEVDTLLGDGTKAREKLGWSPKTSFNELVSEMMQKDLELARRDALMTSAGFHAHTPQE